MGTNIFAFAIVLGVLIFFHELGHFLVARFFGVGVEKFSLGFGPRLFGKHVGITDYRVSAIPLGGYVKMVGEEPDADIDPADIAISFTHKHVLKRILIVAAGPVFNVLLAVIIFYGIFQFSGEFILKPVIGEVQADSPARAAGLVSGDEVVAIGSTAVSSWEDMADLISSSQGRPLAIIIRREGAERTFTIAPQLKTTKNIFGENVPRYVIGITAAGDYTTRELNPLEAFTESLVQSYNVIELTVVSVVKIIQGTVSSKTIGGPIMIAELAGQQAKQGAMNLLFFIALISINLAILNILPIPVLDGGHLLFFFIELIIGRPVSIRVREVAQQAGLFVLILLMIFVFYNDITRIFFSQ
jgi:regulator of sigma E protease